MKIIVFQIELNNLFVFKIKTEYLYKGDSEGLILKLGGRYDALLRRQLRPRRLLIGGENRCLPMAVGRRKHRYPRRPPGAAWLAGSRCSVYPVTQFACELVAPIWAPFSPTTAAPLDLKSKYQLMQTLRKRTSPCKCEYDDDNAFRFCQNGRAPFIMHPPS